VESTAAIVCLCRECHDARHVSRVLHIEGDADQTLLFTEGAAKWWSTPDMLSYHAPRYRARGGNPYAVGA